MKAALVIDMPETCIGDCIFWEDRVCDACYVMEHKPIFDDSFGNDEDDFNRRPDWCPLRPLPEKRELDSTASINLFSLADGWTAQGWNDCLDAITGGGEE